MSAKSWSEFMGTVHPCGHTEAQHQYHPEYIKLEPCHVIHEKPLSVETRLITELERLRQVENVLKQIITDLPAKRDWLDPALEKQAKFLIKKVRLKC